MIYITGTYMIARIIARNRGLEKGGWKHAKTLDNLRGLKKDTKILVTWGTDPHLIKFAETMGHDIEYVGTSDANYIGGTVQ